MCCYLSLIHLFIHLYTHIHLPSVDFQKKKIGINSENFVKEWHHKLNKIIALKNKLIGSREKKPQKKKQLKGNYKIPE